MHICCTEGLDKIRPIAIAALKRGVEIEWYDRSLQWLETNPVIDTSDGKRGSHIYTWSECGNKVLCKKFLCSLDLEDLESEVIRLEISEGFGKYEG